MGFYSQTIGNNLPKLVPNPLVPVKIYSFSWFVPNLWVFV